MRSTVQPVGPAIVIVGLGVTLLLAAVCSDRWLEIVNWRERYDWSDAHVGPIGLFTKATSHGAGFRWPIAALLLSTPVWLLAGLFRRWALHVALACVITGALAVSAWVFAQDDLGAGRAYTLAMVGLAVIACGVTQALMIPIERRKEWNAVGELVDGKKHGRWHIYDERGTCVAIEEWDRGKLVRREPNRHAQ